MLKMRKLVSFVLALALTLFVFTGCNKTPAKEDSSKVSPDTSGTAAPVKETLKIRAVIDAMYAATFKNDPITDDTLVKLVNEKIKEFTGGTAVEVEWIVPMAEQERTAYLNMLVSSGDVPEVLAMNDLAADKNSLELVDTKGIIRALTPELINENMKAYTSRITQYGGKLEDILSENKYNGKNLYLPSGFKPLSFPNISPDTQESGIYYGLYFRDDILKQVFPDAKSDAEMKKLLLEKGEMTPEDIVADIPIKNMEDLYNYLKKVQELNLKVGEKKVIPGNIFRSSEMPDSALWSLATATGNMWQSPLVLNEDLAKSEFPYSSVAFKDYCRWLNKYYNEGLIDSETFVMKDDQVRTKVINGEYAVINATGPVVEAQAEARKRGYGYRYLPAFYPLDFTKMNNKVSFVSQNVRGALLTTTVKDEDFSTILKWLDFYMSEDYDEIRCWGSPDWYIGEGKDRKYKDEYKSIENWVLYGEPSEKDGQYYHMAPPEVLGQSADVKSDPVMRQAGMTFFSYMATYPEGPNFVLPKDKAKLESTEVGQYSASVMNKDAQSKVTFYRQIGWSDVDIYTPKWQEFEGKFWADATTMIAPIAKAISAKETDFDKKWEEYEKVLDAAGRQEAQAEAAAMLADKFKNSTETLK